MVTEGLPPVDDEALGAAALLGGIFSRLAGRQVACVPGGDQRFIVVNLDVAEKVWGWFKDGADLPTIVSQLVPGAR